MQRTSVDIVDVGSVVDGVVIIDDVVVVIVGMHSITNDMFFFFKYDMDEKIRIINHVFSSRYFAVDVVVYIIVDVAVGDNVVDVSVDDVDVVVCMVIWCYD